MSVQAHYIELAKRLPPQLLRFLARYPPATLHPPAPRPRTNSVADADANTEQSPKTSYQLERPNPFLFWKNRATGKWQNPVYSLRQQAVLAKMARAYGIESLLPPSTKATDYSLRRRVESGLLVRGTGVGKKVKGHKYERTALKRMQMKRKAMLGMRHLIAKWRRVGRRKWRMFPDTQKLGPPIRKAR